MVEAEKRADGKGHEVVHCYDRESEDWMTMKRVDLARHCGGLQGKSEGDFLMVLTKVHSWGTRSEKTNLESHGEHLDQR